MVRGHLVELNGPACYSYTKLVATTTTITMDGQFHEVLRDFALEKMKEIESKESTSKERRKAM